MYYTMHHGIVISKFAEINLNYGVGAQFISAGDRSDRSCLSKGEQTGLTGLAYQSDRLLALLKYPFYPLFNFDNGMNLISKSLTILT